MDALPATLPPRRNDVRAECRADARESELAMAAPLDCLAVVVWFRGAVRAAEPVSSR
jgi:hypothetical protein